MSFARVAARVLLGLVTIAGLLHGLLFVASAFGIARPLVVVSGSMEPEIPTGSLVIAVPHATTDLSIGDVVSVPSPVTKRIVTHRLVDIRVDNGTTIATLKGDNNTYADPEPYPLGSLTWTPTMTIPVVGHVMQLASQPLVLVPLVIGLIALFGLAFGTASAVRPSARGRHGSAAPSLGALPRETVRSS